jgi:hypothetical protein
MIIYSITPEKGGIEQEKGGIESIPPFSGFPCL